MCRINNHLLSFTANTCNADIFQCKRIKDNRNLLKNVIIKRTLLRSTDYKSTAKIHNTFNHVFAR